MPEASPKTEGFYTRRNSLRLSGFDYASQRVYFVTIVVDKRRRIFDDDQIAQAVLGCLEKLRGNFEFRIYIYCLMPDHFHALLSPGDSGRSLGAICGAFKSLSTRLHWQWFEGQLWQRRFFDHIIRNDREFFETFEYIKLNPVRKGLVGEWDQWPYTGMPDAF